MSKQSKTTTRKKRTTQSAAADNGQGKALVIVESPAKARTINKYLGPGYVVRASMGHVRDLPETRMGVDIENGFEPTYRIIKGKKATIEELKKEARQARATYLATDPDREGEAIAWHLKEALKLRDSQAFRVRFHEITAPAIREAFQHPDQIDMNKVYAQQARRVLDRIVGYQLSPLLWKKVARGLSAGRVQSVAVRLVVEREREIQQFKPEEYWKITGTFRASEDDPLEFTAELARWNEEKFRPGNEAETQQVLKALENQQYVVVRVKKHQRVENPPPPFQTSTLQQQASIRLRFSATRTMRIAQQLYEGVELGEEGSVGLITYMRTDSLRVAESAIQQCREHIRTVYGEEYLPEKPRQYKSGKGAQEAHEAIRPTDLSYTPERVRPYLTKEQADLYEMIYRRFVASQMKPALIAVTDVEIQAGPGLFRTQGRQLLFEGYRKVWEPSGKQEPALLPELSEGQTVVCVKLEPSQHFTQPPPRYTEATLIKALEKHGVGRPSTYAPTIATIQERGYVELRDRKFYATELGMLVTDLLVKNFPEIVDVQFTSQMESQLDRIEEAAADWRQVLRDFYGPFSEALKRAEETIEKVRGVETEEKCEKCGAPMVIRWSRAGRFLGCSNYPECRNRKSLDGNGDTRAPVVTDHKCPQCGKPLVIRQGRRGPFYACSGHPECKATFDVGPDGKPRPSQQETEYVCEKCGSPMVLRRGRTGQFLGCSAYPQCTNTKPVDAEGRPVEPPKIDITCEKCGKPMVLRRSRKGAFLGCSGYPKCRTTMPIPEELRAEVQQFLNATRPKTRAVPLGKECPNCGKELVLRETSRGLFVGCTGYPKCRFTEQPSPELLASLANGSSEQENEPAPTDASDAA